jgi:pimeloyl-ACP methyl ester carboxylesterase
MRWPRSVVRDDPPVAPAGRHVGASGAAVRRDLATIHPDWAGITAEVVDVHGTAVHVLRAGAPGAGVPHLLVHGLGAASTIWLDVMAGLAPHGEVVAMDLPGFGRTRLPRTGASRMRANARFLPALMDTLGWDRAVVHGNSMGGLLATMVAADAPERVRGLVLVAPALPTSPSALPEVPRHVLMRLGPFALPTVGRALMHRMWTRMTPRELWDDAMRVNVHDLARVRPELAELSIDNIAYGKRAPWRFEGVATATESMVAALVGRRGLTAAIDAVAAPTLLLWGDRDGLVGRPVIDHAVGRRPDWDVVVLEDVGHTPQLEVPGRYLDAVTGWLVQRGLTA